MGKLKPGDIVTMSRNGTIRKVSKRKTDKPIGVIPIPIGKKFITHGTVKVTMSEKDIKKMMEE